MVRQLRWSLRMWCSGGAELNTGRRQVRGGVGQLAPQTAAFGLHTDAVSTAHVRLGSWRPGGLCCSSMLTAQPCTPRGISLLQPVPRAGRDHVPRLQRAGHGAPGGAAEELVGGQVGFGSQSSVCVALGPDAGLNAYMALMVVSIARQHRMGCSPGVHAAGAVGFSAAPPANIFCRAAHPVQCFGNTHEQGKGRQVGCASHLLFGREMLCSAVMPC